MDLKSFVAETLAQIVEGVAEAQRRIAETGTNATVNPTTVLEDARRKIGDPSPVEFDVAVTVTEESRDDSSSKVGGSAGLLSVVTLKTSAELANNTTGSNRNEAVSRIKFAVQLVQPSDIDERPRTRISPSRTGWPA